MSEETTQIDNVISLVEEAQKKGKFSLADAIKGRAFPEKTVDVYIDANSAFKLEAVNEELKELGSSNPEQVAILEKLADDLVAEIMKSKLTFHMRGVGQGVVEDASNAADAKFPTEDEDGNNPEWAKYYIAYLIASNVYKVVDADGNEDTTTYTVDDMLELRSVMPIDSWGVLVETMQQLTLATSYFTAVSDAGFLQRS